MRHFFSSLTLFCPGSCLCVSECVCFSAGSGMASVSGPLRKAALGAGYRWEGPATRRHTQTSRARTQLQRNASAPHVNRCFLPSAPTHMASHTHTHAVVSIQVELGAGGRAEPALAPAVVATRWPLPRRSAQCRKLAASHHWPTPNSLLHFQKKRQQQSFITCIWISFPFTSIFF